MYKEGTHLYRNQFKLPGNIVVICIELKAQKIKVRVAT